MARIKNSQRRKAQPNIKPGVTKHQVPTTASPSIGTSPESEWVINIRQKLDHASQDDDAIWSKLCIYRVPQYLREGDDRGYVPQIVSLGPYHHNKRRLRNMDTHKWRAVSHILKRFNQDIKLYLDAVKELEERARACYEGPISLSSDEFVEMMVLDGCFILELFQGVDEGFEKLGYSGSDPIFSMQGSMNSIQQDMIMLENQIPLFVLDRLFGLQDGQPGAVSKLALRFFDPLSPTDKPSSMEMKTFDPQSGVEDLHCFDVFRRILLRREPKPNPNTRMSNPQPDVGGLHCLDVFRWSLLGSEPQPTPRNYTRSFSNTHRVADTRRQQLINCVTKLRESGINFKTRKVDRFWDIEFKDGVLRIPKLIVHDGTNSLFLNLIAFEQCRPNSKNDITSYVIFMDNLINSSEDVSILHRCGIIEHWLGSEAEVAKLFNSICQEVVFDRSESYLSPLSDQVNKYCNIRWNSWRATLYHIYFRNPWAVISIIAAVILLLLTFTQTFYGVFAYYRPPS